MSSIIVLRYIFPSHIFKCARKSRFRSMQSTDRPKLLSAEFHFYRLAKLFLWIFRLWDSLTDAPMRKIDHEIVQGNCAHFTAIFCDKYQFFIELFTGACVSSKEVKTFDCCTPRCDWNGKEWLGCVHQKFLYDEWNIFLADLCPKIGTWTCSLSTFTLTHY